MTASNTYDCFREFVGQKVLGVLFNALPLNRRDLSDGTKTLIFEDGRGLTIASNGSYWIDDKENISIAIREKQQVLEKTKTDLQGVLALTGG